MSDIEARYNRLASWARAHGGNVEGITQSADADDAKPAVHIPDDRKRVARVIEAMEEHQITQGAGQLVIDGCDVGAVLNVLTGFAKPVGVVIGERRRVIDGSDKRS